MKNVRVQPINLDRTGGPAVGVTLAQPTVVTGQPQLVAATTQPTAAKVQPTVTPVVTVSDPATQKSGVVVTQAVSNPTL